MSRSIQEWEKEISTRFRQVRLLGEIELSQEDFDELTDEIRFMLKRAPNIQEATRRLEKICPKTFATFLAHFAARNTNREFWDALAALVESSSGDLNNANWRKLFIKILKDDGKPTFEDVGGVTNKYVTAMRIHGGIPVYSLQDFFKNMIKPALEREQYRGLKPAELLDALLQRSEVQFFTDSPVRNFFEYSGKVGVEFLNECVKMARAYQKDGEVPPNINLPAYVIQAFIAFMEQQVEFETKLKAPRLLFDPEGDGLVVDLPQQQISAKDLRDSRQAVWQIAWDDQTMVITKRSKLGFSGRDIVSRADQVIIPEPVGKVRVGFGLQSAAGSVQVMRRWTLHFLPGENQPPLIAFNLRNDNYASLLRINQTLPPKVMLLLHPTDVELVFEGDAEKRHECDPLEGSWRKWRADYWALEKALQLTLIRQGKEIGIFRISSPFEVPSLVDGRLCTQTVDPKGIPLYIGTPPRLRIPERPGQKWRIHLESVWETAPHICRDFTSHDLNLVDHALELDLEGILGFDAAGTYRLEISDGQGYEDEYRFRVWPRLQIKDLPDAIFPSNSSIASMEEVHFNLVLPPSALCKPRSEAEYIKIEGEYGHYAVTVFNEEITQADLDLILPQRDGNSPITVPLYVPIPRLQWRFILPGEESIYWTTASLKQSVDGFLQAIQRSSNSVLVKMPGISNICHKLEMDLVDPDQPDTPLMSFPPEKVALGDDYLRFSLNKVYDTLRARHDVPVFSFELRLLDKGIIQERVNLLTLTRSLEISNVRLEDHGDLDYTLRWSEPYIIRNRRVFIKPLWQPWNAGVEIKIPDEINGELRLNEIGLPPSRYQAYFYILPPWQPELTAPPDVKPHHFRTVHPEDYLQSLEKRLAQQPKRAFQIHFERACIYADLEIHEKCRQEIGLCAQHHEQANLRTFLLFYNWLGDYDENEQKSIRAKLLVPQRLQELFENTKSDDPLRETILQHAQNRMLPTQSAIVLLKYSNDPQLILFCLRLLLERLDDQGVTQIIQMVKEGHLSDADALDLLTEETSFSLKKLAEHLDEPDALRLFTTLFSSADNPSQVIEELPSSSLLKLTAIDYMGDQLHLILGQLISRGEIEGVKGALRLFEEEVLLGHEVTGLLGVNPRFSYDALNTLPATQFRNVQIAEIARIYGVGPEKKGGDNSAKPGTANSHQAVDTNKLSQLIANKEKQGVYQSLTFAALGKISDQQLFSILSQDPDFSYQILLENPKVQQYQDLIIKLARRYPIQTGHFTVGMFILTPAGWGKIEKILSSQDEVYDIARQDEPDLSVQITLTTEGSHEKAMLDFANTKLVFEGKKQAYRCDTCKDFYTSRQDLIQRHVKVHHKDRGTISTRPPVLPIYRPFQFKFDQEHGLETLFKNRLQRSSSSLLIASLPTKQLIRLAGSSDFTQLCKDCIATLIKRGQDDGIKLVISYWQQRRITDEEAIALFGKNPESSFTFMDALPAGQRPTLLIQLLAEQYPVETLHIKPGMFIKTPAGWGKITTISDEHWKPIPLCTVEAPKIKLQLVLHPNSRPEPVTVDMSKGQLQFPPGGSYRCDICGECISSNENFISHNHTQAVHSGMKPQYSKLPSIIPFKRILEFSTDMK